MSIVYLGIGSNIGNRDNNIRQAVSLLKETGIEIAAVSSLIETDPVGGPPQGKFLNGAIKIKTILSPQELLQTLKSIEQKLGRTKTVKDGPRVIDLDILLYEDATISSDALTIPHPRMLERAFVIKPLNEIAPEIVKGLMHADR